jgi:acetyl-CoA C-acetyltransferase
VPSPKSGSRSGPAADLMASEVPCIIGVAQETIRPDATAPGDLEPLAMWELVARSAAADAGVPGLVSALDSIAVVDCQSWAYDDPTRRLAECLGATPTHVRYTGPSGTAPQVAVAAAGKAIRAGKSQLALVTGAEALASLRALAKHGSQPAWTHARQGGPAISAEDMPHESELAHGLFRAPLSFALFDLARRARLGLGADVYRKQLGALLAPLTDVAAENPRAWFPVARTAEELVEPTAANRMVSYPYTKLMTAFMDVDMAAAVLVASEAKADDLGVPRDRRVYLRGWGYAEDANLVAERPDLSRSPAMRAASTAALRMAGVDIDDVAHLDLYSCFPSALNFALEALGMAADDPRPLTQTGGLPYFGGPASNYMSHSIAAMVETLRADPGALGMVSGVGMVMTKHAFGVYSTTPGPIGPPTDSAQVSAGERSFRASYEGPASLAAYSVWHGRDGAPESALAVCDIGEHERCYAVANDSDALSAMEDSDLVGARVDLRAGPGGTNLLTLGRDGEASRK